MCNIKNHKLNCPCTPPSQKGKKRSEETKEKLKLSHKGPRPWRVGKSILKNRGEKHFAWKGDKVGYEALHAWIHREMGKAKKCQNSSCKYPRKNSDGEMMQKPKRFEWANISKNYKRDKEDWVMLCPSCHRLYDARKIIL